MKKGYYIIIAVAVVILIIAGIFIYERSKASLYNSEESNGIIGGGDGPTAIFIAGNINGQMNDGYYQISMSEAEELFKTEADYLIVDVRRPDEFSEGHIPNAINIPNEDITDSEPELLPDKDQMIFIYCRSGNRSKQASKKLADMGYSKIVEFGGILDWNGEVVKEVSEGNSETDHDIYESDYFSIEFSEMWKDKYDVLFYPSDNQMVWSIRLKTDITGIEYMGHLFSIFIMEEKEDYWNNPDYRYYGLVDINEVGRFNVMFTFPTDVQFDPEYQDIYQELFSDVDNVLETFTLKEADGTVTLITREEEPFIDESNSGTGFSDEELCQRAKQHYCLIYGEEPPIAEVDSVDGDTITIHLYEIATDHTATWDWYYISRITGKGTNLFGEEVDLASIPVD